MHVNQKIDLLVRASRLYCHNMYREYDPKYYPTIKNVVLNFTNKLFGTKRIESKVKIDIISLFEGDIENRPMWKVYSGMYSHRVSRYFSPRIRAVKTSPYIRKRRYLLQTGSNTS